jgi:hypothetical protein
MRFLEPLQVGDRVVEQNGIVKELGKPAVAVEAKYSPHSTGCVVVIDVFGLAGLADGADTVLLKDQPLDRHGVEVVTAAEMELPSGAVVFLVVSATNTVVAGLAVVAIP